MSLQVWLPLNGDLHNQGLSDVTVTNNGATVNTSGKIGKCYSFDGSNSCIELNAPSLYNIIKGGNQPFTIMFWIYHAAASRGIIFGDYGLTGTIQCNVELQSNHRVRFYWAGAPDKNFSTSVGENTWCHIALVYDGSQVIIYKNGVLQIGDSYSGTLTTKSKTTGVYHLGRDYRNETNLNGKINDVRIYDHALSAKEVEEIAKGLVLHYKLDNNYTVNENLMPNHLEMGLGSANPSTGTWRLAGSSSMTKSRVQILDSPEGPCYGFQNEGIQTPNDGSCYGIDSFPLEGNSIYTISMWARIISGTEGYAGYNIYNSTDKGGSHSSTQKNYRVTQLPSNGDWIKCWYTFTTNSNNTRNIYIGIVTGETSVTTQMCCVHIEKVDATTYTTIYDCSGYNNNGTLSNGMTNILYNTPRYNTSLCLSKKKISANTGFPTGTNPDFTIVFWTRLYSDITYVSYGDLVGMNDIAEGANSPFRLELCGTPPSNNLMWFRGPSGQASGGFNMNSNSSSGWFSKGVWHQIALTGNGATKQYLCYLDGAQCGAYNGSNNTWTPNGKIYFGDTVEATADFSDCRVYATVLTAEQIKELYNTSMSIDDKGNIHARELVEL